MRYKERDQFFFRNLPADHSPDCFDDFGVGCFELSIETRTTATPPIKASTRSAGLEPTTQGLEIPCSIQLSYERKCTGLKDGKVNLG
jgi:hypothetical protein